MSNPSQTIDTSKTPNPIPFFDFGGSGPVIHFAHANGYPPQAYQPLMDELVCGYKIMAMRMKPLWPGVTPESIQNWLPLSNDLAVFLDQHSFCSIIGAGHSMGGIATLRLALDQPWRFKALVLIDPVLFPPWMIHFWNLLSRIGLVDKTHPLIKTARKRRDAFDSKDEMLTNYRQKHVFRYLDDKSLLAYVDAIAQTTVNGTIELAYPRDWEAQIYVTGIKSDMDLWQRLHLLQPPLLVIRGAETDTFWKTTSDRLRRLLPSARIETIPKATHLVPLERPEEVSVVIRSFLTKIV